MDSLARLLGLVDLDVVELHPWQATIADIETADLMVFDLDPGDGVEWAFVSETALSLRNFLQRHGLESWPKTSGGKGLHIIVPLQDGVSHDDARQSSKLVAEAFAERDGRYITRSAPFLRAGHIFIDYLLLAPPPCDCERCGRPTLIYRVSAASVARSNTALTLAASCSSEAGFCSRFTPGSSTPL